ncbi:citrate lyase acyl carrier protein citd [Lucifera butyrica]|uniref:Citrate lyase acyl carrier protein citd n=1 Tax=Lucifera butyrica TaxID=1351585 RepID=A0A498R1E4_9FIRM|nr:citrate lyase acyl carrier protein [Lucifera butyrica]VBB05254.1 citrate lyase acyl carrier protein citd [Lucifera butyrica]
MSLISRPGQAGTVESNDIMVTVAPAEPGKGIAIELKSPVAKQFGRQIRAVIIDTLQECGISDAAVFANDKGALDCTIRARVKTAVGRALKQEEEK